MSPTVRNMPSSSDFRGPRPSGVDADGDNDNEVVPTRPSGRGMLQVAVDESRRSSALKAPVRARVD